ncbi:MAG: hypothetical protein JNJ45_01070 [Chthonomonas sp.]|nr:hypothetical protein [Chthonomonas sp.]
MAGLSALTVVTNAQIFADPCESLSAYTVVQNPDASAEVVNYGSFTLNDSLGNPVSISIPEAPRPISGGGATTGIMLRANKNDLVAGTQGINLILSASGTPIEVSTKYYKLSLDCYMKCDAPTGVGTTEAFNAGVSRLGSAGPFGYYNRSTAGDGNWITYVGDGGINGTDMRNYRGTTQLGGLDVSNPICQSVFSAVNGYEFIGAPSGNWSRVDLIVNNGVIYWRMNGTPMLSGSSILSTDGKVWFGYDDPFGGVAGAPEKQYAIVDNVVVTELPKFTGTLAVSGYAGDITTETFTAQIFDSAGVLTDSLPFKVDASGNFEFGTTIPASGSVVIVGDSTLNRWMQSVTPTVSGTSLGNVNLLNGNINGDAVIDIGDYTILAAKFDASSSDPDWNTAGGDGFKPSQADITGDGVVDIADYTQIAANFDAASEYIP